MGSTRKALDAPGPRQLLAIFGAKENGVTLSEIARRTRYSKSTILRWYAKWKSDVPHIEGLDKAHRLVRAEAFHELFPEPEAQQPPSLSPPLHLVSPAT